MAKREPRPEDLPDPEGEVQRIRRVERVPEPDPERVDRIEIVRPIPVGSPAVAGPVVVTPGPFQRTVGRILNAVDYAFYVIYGLLGIRLVLTLMGAREGAAFTRLIHRLTGPLYAPFDDIVARPKLDGGSVDFPILIALMGYGLLHVAIRGLVRVIQGRSSAR